MNRISGKGGNVFAVGDLFGFNGMPLHEHDEDGWTWEAPEGLGCWSGPLQFEVSDDGEDWEWIDPEEVYPNLGRVVFPRSLHGMLVRASGACRPTAFVGWGQSWQIMIDTNVAAAPAMTGRRWLSSSTTKSTVAVVDGVVSQPLDRVFVRLPFQKGAYVGFGELTQLQAGVKVTFDDKGVTYEPYN
jgi:hypothetical protein